MMNLFAKRAQRLLAVSMLSLAIAGCSVTGEGRRNTELSDASSPAMTHYAVHTAETFAVDAVDTSDVDPQYLKQVVDYRSTHPPGTVVVDPHKRFLYLVLKGGKAIRYGVGVGREGLAFAGTGTVQEKKEWPRWTPTPAMIAREPKRYAKWGRRHGRRRGKPARRQGALPVQERAGHALPDPWHDRARQHRQGGFLRLHPHAEPGRH
jgi:lipoprotein-anchoring transpeptidase ErfK/SrfK